MPMGEKKSKIISITIPIYLLDAIDKNILNKSRSAFFRDLARLHLYEKGFIDD